MKELKKRENDDEKIGQQEVVVNGVKYAYDPRHGARSKNEFEQEIRQLWTVVNFLREEQKQNFSQENQSKLERAEKRLEELSSLYNNNNNNNNHWSMPAIIGTAGLVALLGLIVYKLSRRKVRR